MADGLNEARALRVTELLKNYQTIQRRIAELQANPRQDEYHEVGYTTLRQCHADARALLNKAYPPEMLHPPSGSNENEKRQLQRVIVDCSARRFQAQKIQLRASAAMKWIGRRNAILQGQKPKSVHLPQLQQADTTLRNEILAITDQRVFTGLRTSDQQFRTASQTGYWLQDDPSLQTLLAWIQSH
ncbi:hypothetical protein P7C71_g5098, partial [Lecanoromycetidae sp. Uapishka_2]